MIVRSWFVVCWRFWLVCCSSVVCFYTWRSRSLGALRNDSSACVRTPVLFADLFGGLVSTGPC